MGGRLAGRVVCVTGAGRGLGRALAEACAAEGARLVLGARTVPELEAVAAATGGVAVPTDVRDPLEVDRLVETAIAEFGQLDVMINNAGLAVYGPLESMTPEDVAAMLDTNVKGTIWGSRAALRVMKARRSGHIVNISSIAGKMHLPNESVYCASKWAVNGFTGVLRQEAQPHGVKVTVVCPGGIDTPFWKALDFHPFPDHLDPERDFMKAEEIAQTVIAVLTGSPGYTIPEVVMVPMV